MKSASRGRDPQNYCPPDLWCYKAAIRACDKGWSWECTLKLFAEMQERSIEPDFQCSASAVSACGKGKQWQHALRVLDQMELDGLQPDQWCVRSALHCCKWGAQWQRSLELVRRLWYQDDKEANMSPAERRRRLAKIKSKSFLKGNNDLDMGGKLIDNPRAVDDINASIAACDQGGQWEKALWLLTVMQLNGPKPNYTTFVTVINACQDSSKWEHAMSVLEELRLSGLRPGREEERHAIKQEGGSGAAGGLWWWALKLLKQIRDEGSCPSLANCNAVLSSCQEGGGWEQTLMILEEMKELGPRPNRSSYLTALGTCGLAGSWADALRLLEEMRDHSFHPDSKTFEFLVEACERGDQLETGLEVIRWEMRATAESSHSWRPFPVGNCRQWQVALRILKGMQSKREPPGLSCYNLVMATCARRGQWTAALDVLQDLKCSPILPDVASYNAVVLACCQSGQWTVALELLEEMLENGPKPSSETFRTAIACCDDQGHWQIALELLQKMDTCLGPALLEGGTDEEAAVNGWDIALRTCESKGMWVPVLNMVMRSH